MSEELQVGLLVGLLSGGFALLGGAVTHWATKRREARQFRTEAALELADTERFIWGSDWVELNISLQRQETRLIVAGAPPELVQALRNMSRFCWFDHQESAERYSDTEFADYVGISTELLDARRDVSRAIANHLLRTGKRSMRRQAESRAVENAQRIWNDPQHQRIRKLVDPPASQKSFGMRADNAGGAGADEAPEEPKAP